MPRLTRLLRILPWKRIQYLYDSILLANVTVVRARAPCGEAQWECQIHGALFCVSVIQYTNSRALSGAIALLYLFIPPSPSTPMCGDFNKPAETSLTLMANGMKQSGRTRRRALRVKCLGKGIRRCPMSASCSWRLCQVTFSSGPPTTLFTYTYCTWRMGSLEFRGKKKLNVRIPKLWEPYRPRCIRRLMVAHFFKVVFNGRYIRKQNLATRTRFEVSLTRRKFL